jgi:hypothetical protein
VKLIATTWAAIIMLAALPAGASQQQSWSSRFPLQPGGAVRVENVQGDVTVEAWDRAEVEVSVLKTAPGPGGHPEDVAIAVERSEGTLTLRTLYPKQSEEPVRVDYSLRVPRQVRLDGVQTVEGNITVRGVEGSVDARTLNGNIEQTNITGSVVARAVNGSIVVSLRALPEPTDTVHLETISGDVFLALPPEVNADLKMATVAGRVDSGYAYSVSEIPGDHTRRTRLGRGGAQVSLRTVRGDIRVVESEDLL